MMFQPRTLRQYAYPDRFATWGLPFVWIVVFVQRLAPFLSQNLVYALVVVFVGLSTLHGPSRPLTLPPELDARVRPVYTWRTRCVRWTVRAANTLCDAASAACSVFFVEGIYVGPVPYFAPLFVCSVALHCFVELQVDKVLSELHEGGRERESFGGRGFQPEEMRQLVSVETVSVKLNDLL